ncbi:hypothetical protein [Thalassobacillus devorans]|uniref:hypothetical protein n=1 Tax=Thalassobacillus devorans TaxID=279813 RepID=UPI0004AECB64|nr:hypothetical protein [Thalassobacillus devorans]
MKYKATAIIMGAAIFLAACGGAGGKDQGADEGLMDTQNTEERGNQIDNPRMINNVGDSWGLKQDREKIKSAAESVPGVEVERVILEGPLVRVTANVPDNSLSDGDRQDWEQQIEQAIYRAVPRYDIKVRVR